MAIQYNEPTKPGILIKTEAPTTILQIKFVAVKRIDCRNTSEGAHANVITEVELENGRTPGVDIAF